MSEIESYDAAVSPFIIGAIAGGVGVLVVGLVMPARKCPQCATRLPKFRKPANKRQAMWGGTTCPACGCESDRKGHKIVSQ